MNFFITTMISFLISGGQVFAASLGSLAIQDQGRIKPYETFARESLQLIYGKESYEGRSAEEIVLTWLLYPAAWEKKEMIEISYHLVKQALKLPTERKYFSTAEIFSNERLMTLLQDLQSKREQKVKLDPYYQAVQRLEGQLSLYRGIVSGEAFAIAPPTDSTSKWRSLEALSEKERAAFTGLTKIFLSYIGAIAKGGSVEIAAQEQSLNEASGQLQSILIESNPQAYPVLSDLEVEVFYNHFHPYRWAWICYLLGAVMLGLSWLFQKQKLYPLAWVTVSLGMLLQISGMALRIYLMGRPPVTNMYETVVWVGFGAVVFSMFIEAVYRWRFILLAGSFVGCFCLVLANMAPVILSNSLQPLEPVLRSNFWLTIHVMTITISYAAFFLAFALGDIALLYYLRGEGAYEKELKAMTLSIYRATQIGVSFLTPGIILGGVWADYSWGRFWGWDPKETWALIVLLGYVAVMHGRLSGWIKDFGLAVSAIVSFSLVIMAWYGVNYILGAGLHSYGFGAGGVEYVATFVAIHIVFVVFVAVVRKARLQKTSNA